MAKVKPPPNLNPAASTGEAIPAELEQRSLLSGHALVFTALVLVAALLGVWRLEHFPATWFDEGWLLQIPKNLVQYGEYATRSSEGFRYWDTVLNASPVLYLPIAAALAVGGVSLLQARIVIVAFFLLGCILIYAVARRLHGPTSGLLAMSMFVFVSHGGPGDISTAALVMGRQVLAEVPALCFLLGGMLVWTSAFDRRSRAWLVASGVLFGLAVTVKSQFMLAVLPMWVALAALDVFFYRQRRLALFIIPLIVCLGVIAAHQLLYLGFLGTANYSRFLDDLRDASGPQVRVFFSSAAMLEAARLFLRSPYSLVFFPAVMYVLVLSLRRDAEDIRSLMPTVFVVGWLTWYSFASVGWYRYAFPGLAVSYILTARFLVELGGLHAGFIESSIDAARVRNLAPLARGLSVSVTAVAVMIVSARDMVPSILHASDDYARQMATYIEANVAADEVIDTWEWEVAFQTRDQEFHFPPTRLLPSVIARQEPSGGPTVDQYNPLDYDIDYILVGQFAEWTNLYPKEFLSTHASEMTRIGRYTLYRVNSLSNQASPP